jgi:hypothetical protein
MKKPVSSDPEQRRHDTRVSRFQSGLPPEDESEENEEQPKPQESGREASKEKGASDAEP